MNELKFLGKPAPDGYTDIVVRAGLIDAADFNEASVKAEKRMKHLEGAIKEANFMLVTFRKKWPKEIWKEWDAWLDTQPIHLTEEYGSYEKHFIAFLLQKTIGERT